MYELKEELQLLFFKTAFTKTKTYTNEVFTYQTNLRTYTNKVISIMDLVNQIKDNPHKNKITEIHNLPYKCKEYNKLKETLPCIKINGTFSGLSGADIISFNNYLYFDIDDTTVTPNELISEYPFISLVTKSVGGRGIFFLVKVDVELTTNNHKNVWSYLTNNVFTDLNIDRAAYSIPRNTIIPYYPEVYYNEVTYTIDSVKYDQWHTESHNIKVIKTVDKEREKKGDIITLNEPSLIDFKPYELKELYKRIKIRTEYKGDIKGLYTIEEMNSYTILIPRIIKDGSKRKLYSRIINALIYINDTITLQETLSYIYHINTHAMPAMNYYKMINYTTFIYNSIMTTGEIKIKPRIKKIHFDVNKKLTVKQKQSIAAKTNGALRTNKTIDIINDAIMTLAKMNEVPTNKRLCEITGFSLATIKRNKNKTKTDPMRFNESYIDKEEEKDVLKPSITLDEFFVGINE